MPGVATLTNQSDLSPTSGSNIKASGDLMSLFLGSGSHAGALTSPSIYDKVKNSSSGVLDKSKMYERSYSLRSAGSSSYTSSSPYGSRYYSSAASGYLSSTSTPPTTSSRYGRSLSSYSSSYNYRTRNNHTYNRDNDDNNEKAATSTKEDENNNNNNSAKAKKKKAVPKPTTVMNGNVIRINRQRQVVSTSDEESETESESEEEESEDSAESEQKPTTPPPPPPPPPPEDPLDVEERMLNAQLALSFTLTMTDEENIRQRLMEIKKTRIKKTGSEITKGLVDKFEKEAEELTEADRAKEVEEKILINRLTAESIREVEQKDIQVRLQEIFRDRKTSLEVTQKNMETHYEHMLQETSTEMSELDTSIRGKQSQIEKLQEEVLSMTVRKELLSAGMEKINHRHQEQIDQLNCQRNEIEAKMSQYAVLAPSPVTRKVSAVIPEQELKEIEQELECPVCMDISRPPIYQCEEGHLICSTCKPLLTNCPHCSKVYSNPVIRCRFAEKLSEKYFKMITAEDSKDTDTAKADAESNGVENLLL